MMLKGARQVVKTWLMKEFGKNYYKSFVYFNFDEEDGLKSIFRGNKNSHRIIEWLVSAGMLNRVYNVGKTDISQMFRSTLLARQKNCCKYTQ